jgi:hypothetical protein
MYYYASSLRMYAPLWLAHREPAGINQEKLEPIDYRILHLRFLGWGLDRIALAIERPLAELEKRIGRPTFLETQTEVERGVLQSIIRQGEYEPNQIAKAAAPDAMRRIVKQSQIERDPRTRLQANKTVLQFAGVEPPKKLEITTPDRVLEQMTAAELEQLAEHRLWPARFKEVLRAFLPAPPLLDITPPKQEREHPPMEMPADPGNGPPPSQGNRINPASLD